MRVLAVNLCVCRTQNLSLELQSRGSKNRFEIVQLIEQDKAGH